MLQWLIDSAKGKDAETNRLVTRMLFLNMAAMHRTALTATNVLLDLCTRPDDLAMLREEMEEAVVRDDGITASTLNSLRLTDSFMRESRRWNPLGLRTFAQSTQPSLPPVE
jgi:cytochrome P450